MTQSILLSRRRFAGLALAGALIPVRSAAGAPGVTVHKDPGCGCCTGWVEHMQQNGFPMRVMDNAEIDRVKARLGVPPDLAACHTAEVEDYVLEGHVPALAARRLLAERPRALGLAVPGMPAGSPGMGGEPETYQVILFGPDGRRSFGRFKGSAAI